MYGLSEEEYQRIETEMTSLCLRGMALSPDSPEHEEIRQAIKAHHEKYDHLFKEEIGNL